MSVSKVAVYWDFENLHASLFNARNGPQSYGKCTLPQQERLLNIPVLMKYICSLGDVVVNRAYNDWQGFGCYRDDLLRCGIDLVQLYPRGLHGKNGADIRLALDTLEDAITTGSLTHAVILGGDSDYIAVAQKLTKPGSFKSGICSRH